MMKVAGIAIAVVLLLGLAVLVVGAFLPKDHRIARALNLARSPAEVFKVVSDVTNATAWRPGLKSVVVLNSGNPLTFREVSADGSITYEVVESVPSSRFVTRIADPGLPFGGTWTITLEPMPTGTRLVLVENGEVRNIFFRFMSRYVFGHAKSAEAYLRALALKLGETPRIDVVS